MVLSRGDVAFLCTEIRKKKESKTINDKTPTFMMDNITVIIYGC